MSKLTVFLKSLLKGAEREALSNPTGFNALVAQQLDKAVNMSIQKDAIVSKVLENAKERMDRPVLSEADILNGFNKYLVDHNADHISEEVKFRISRYLLHKESQASNEEQIRARRNEKL